MGEPTCLMHQQPFSYVAGLPNDSNEGDALHTLAQSISFGRFVSESLAWDKWSSFSHNRYVEEAERFSRPGSVAQKKAFFEAHYKNLAARKAAALLEQANAAAAKNDPEPAEVGIEANATQDAGILPSNSEFTVDKQVDVKGIDTEERFVCQDNGEKWQVELKSPKEEAVDLSNKNQIVADNCIKVESLSQAAIADTKNLNEVELSAAKLMEKPLLKDFVSDRDDLASAIKKKTASSKFNSSRASKLPCSPAKPAALLRAKKENNATPISKKPATDFIDRRRLTPKSNHKSMNFTPVREVNQITSTIIRKIDNSRVTLNSKALKDCSTPIRTPTMVSVLREPKHTLATPQSESRRAKTPLHPSASGSKSVRSKWHFLPTDCSKFMSAHRNKSPSPNLSSPFQLRTEDRATRRKERLEEKFNSNQAQKVQLQTTLKEKAEAELKKLRQSLCFKARPLPKFYKETRKNQMEKVPLTRQQSPNLLRTPSPKMVHTTAQPAQRSSFKTGGYKHAMGKKNENTLSLTSRLRSITHENTSPNIPNE